MHMCQRECILHYHVTRRFAVDFVQRGLKSVLLVGRLERPVETQQVAVGDEDL